MGFPMTARKITRQRRWQIEQSARGRCRYCRERKVKGYALCKFHLEYDRERKARTRNHENENEKASM